TSRVPMVAMLECDPLPQPKSVTTDGSLQAPHSGHRLPSGNPVNEYSHWKHTGTATSAIDSGETSCGRLSIEVHQHLIKAALPGGFIVLAAGVFGELVIDVLFQACLVEDFHQGPRVVHRRLAGVVVAAFVAHVDPELL